MKNHYIRSRQDFPLARSRARHMWRHARPCECLRECIAELLMTLFRSASLIISLRGERPCFSHACALPRGFTTLGKTGRTLGSLAKLPWFSPTASGASEPTSSHGTDDAPTRLQKKLAFRRAKRLHGRRLAAHIETAGLASMDLARFSLRGARDRQR